MAPRLPADAAATGTQRGAQLAAMSALAAISLIPLATVSLALWAADTASRSDVRPGLVALTVGVVIGLASHRLVVAASRGVVAVTKLLVRVDAICSALSTRAPMVVAVEPRSGFVACPVSMGTVSRRGPPVARS